MMMYQAISLSLSVVLCYMIACISEIYFSMLFSRFESDTLISHFTTFWS